MVDPVTGLATLGELAQVPGLLKEVYGDLAKPGVAQVGKALGTVIGLGNTALWPIEWLNGRAKIALEANLERYRQRMAEVPPEKVVEVPPEVGVPIAEKLSYVKDPTLADLYVNLLSKASTETQSPTVHPSFVNVLNNLSPDEGLLLRHFAVIGALPFIDLRLVEKANGTWQDRPTLVAPKVFGHGLAFPGQLPMYLRNFATLGLVDIFRDKYIADDAVYEAIQREYFSEMVTAPTHERIFKRGKLEVTHYGWLFANACTRPASKPKA